ncbi:TerC family protein [Desulforamulus ruminis]|uniref:Integral membrane protein TerC n=1 Tax=Desulforamulus ruminis (strain ATCC 23193 / DSM 2154 / NCIMB 8452 / DL) TaxID=696281 RepID=F6DLM3_DESRL|nr:TerC family protein [Desulforamulus ruminis]AEG61665.1 Integral membrane protein TerC [Desulforamulus ruminis DSM 2154]
MEFVVGLLSIICLDIVLGGDNAIIIAMASKNLPPAQRKKAILWGTAGAVAVRVALTFVALELLKIPLLQFVGGLVLLWIAFKLLKQEPCQVNVKSGCNLWDAIKTIIIADIAMGVDNVVAIAGAAHGNIVLVVLGLAISIPIIVWGSGLVLKLMDRYPVVSLVGAGILAWTSGSMMVHDPMIQKGLAHIPMADLLVPGILLLLILVVGNRRSSLALEKESA